MGSSSAPAGAKVLDWREEAVGAYRQSKPQAIDRLRRELADRVLELTGQAVESRAIYVDPGARRAIAVVEGVVFRLRCRELFLVRPCVYCGVRHFESAAIHDLVDLGYALSVWEPCCEGCGLEDEDWTHSF